MNIFIENFPIIILAALVAICGLLFFTNCSSCVIPRSSIKARQQRKYQLIEFQSTGCPIARTWIQYDAHQVSTYPRVNQEVLCWIMASDVYSVCYMQQSIDSPQFNQWTKDGVILTADQVPRYWQEIDSSCEEFTNW